MPPAGIEPATPLLRSPSRLVQPTIASHRTTVVIADRRRKYAAKKCISPRSPQIDADSENNRPDEDAPPEPSGGVSFEVDAPASVEERAAG
jgi:hypothetical protein